MKIKEKILRYQNQNSLILHEPKIVFSLEIVIYLYLEYDIVLIKIRIKAKLFTSFPSFFMTSMQLLLLFI